MRMKLCDTVVSHPVCAFLTVTLDKILKKQAEIFKTADERIKLAQQKQKEQYKKRKGIVEYNFKIGNKVLRRNMLQKTRKGNKGEDRWLGPYVIELTTTSAILRNEHGKTLKRRVSLNQLKHYIQPDAMGGDWLNDGHIAAASTLLRKQYPHQNGLLSTQYLAKRLKWQSSNVDFVQIILVSGNHWVCASNILSPPGLGTVDVYDSLPLSHSSVLECQLAVIMHHSASSFLVRYVNV